jgi:hypothetical protein
MSSKFEYLLEMDQKIKLLETTAKELSKLGLEQENPSVCTNTRRILSSVNLLKLNISDAIDYGLLKNK